MIELEHKHVPRRGEIWFVELPTDPPGKGRRPVVIVSSDAQNRNPRADTVLVVPLTTTLKEVPTHVYLLPGETGLQEASCIKAEDITVVRKATLQEPRTALRTLTHFKICRIADAVRIAMGC